MFQLPAMKRRDGSLTASGIQVVPEPSRSIDTPSGSGAMDGMVGIDIVTLSRPATTRGGGAGLVVRRVVGGFEVFFGGCFFAGIFIPGIPFIDVVSFRDVESCG